MPAGRGVTRGGKVSFAVICWPFLRCLAWQAEANVQHLRMLAHIVLEVRRLLVLESVVHFRGVLQRRFSYGEGWFDFICVPSFRALLLLLRFLRRRVL